MTAIEGQLGAGALANLLQYLALNRSTGCLILRSGDPGGAGEQGTVYLRDGAIVHVRSDAATDLDALAQLLGWHRGRFVFRAGIRAPYETLAMATDRILLEASVRSDEVRRETPAATLSVGTVLALAEGGPAESAVATTLRGIRLLREVDGRSDLGEIAERMGVRLTDALAAAEELLEQGLVARRRPPLLGPDFVAALTRLVIERIGPLGEIVVEDALYDLGIDARAMPRRAAAELVEEVAAQFRRDDWAREFRDRAAALVRRYAEPP